MLANTLASGRRRLPAATRTSYAEQMALAGSTEDDRMLIGRCLDGEQSAWDALVDRYSRLVFSIPRRYGLTDADAEDVHQNVFISLFRHLEKLDEPDRLAGWLCTTAHRESWRIGRRNPDTAASLDQLVVDVGSPNGADAERWEREHLVRIGLERLGGRCQDLLAALFAEQQPDYEAISQALGMPVGSIGPTRARCFGKLRTILTDLGLAPSEKAVQKP